MSRDGTEGDAYRAAKKMQEIILKKRTAAIFALAKRHSEEALQDFFRRQIGDEFWNNQTGQALARVFSFAFRRQNSIGFRMAHGVEYGEWLERANDRKHEAIRPMVFEHGLYFLNDVRKLLS
jgi:hypothetical protein